MAFTKPRDTAPPVCWSAPYPSPCPFRHGQLVIVCWPNVVHAPHTTLGVPELCQAPERLAVQHRLYGFGKETRFPCHYKNRHLDDTRSMSEFHTHESVLQTLTGPAPDWDMLTPIYHRFAHFGIVVRAATQPPFFIHYVAPGGWRCDDVGLFAQGTSIVESQRLKRVDEVTAQQFKDYAVEWLLDQAVTRPIASSSRLLNSAYQYLSHAPYTPLGAGWIELPMSHRRQTHHPGAPAAAFTMSLPHLNCETSIELIVQPDGLPPSASQQMQMFNSQASRFHTKHPSSKTMVWLLLVYILLSWAGMVCAVYTSERSRIVMRQVAYTSPYFHDDGTTPSSSSTTDHKQQTVKPCNCGKASGPDNMNQQQNVARVPR